MNLILAARRLALPLLLLAGAASAADTWKSFTTDDGLPSNEVQFLREDEGKLWVGTMAGLAQWHEGKSETVVRNLSTWDLLKLGPGRYIVGTGRGAIHLEGGKQTTQLAGHSVAPLVAMNGLVWAIAKNLGNERNLLMAYDGGAWAPVPWFDKEKVADLFQTPDGRVWVTVEGNGILEVNPAKALHDTTRHLEGTNVTAVSMDSKGRLWAGLWGGGVMMYEGGKWQRHLAREKASIFTIREDAKGIIWVATSATGIWRYDGTDWVNDLKDEGGVNLLVPTKDGKVWISTQHQGGLRYWDGKAWVVSQDSPLPIRTLLESAKGQLWAGGVLDGLHLKQ